VRNRGISVFFILYQFAKRLGNALAGERASAPVDKPVGGWHLSTTDSIGQKKKERRRT
jgi:hypothetical protein